MTSPDLRSLSEDEAEHILRTYYTAIIALRHFPPELVLYICQLADFTSPWPDRNLSSVVKHQPSRFQRTVFRTSPPTRIVPWLRTRPIPGGVSKSIRRIEVRAYSHAPYPASKAVGSVYFNPLSGGTSQRRVNWKNFSLRLLTPANRKQAKSRYDDTPLSWPCFTHNPTLPPDAEPQPNDPGVMLVDKTHELWEWLEPEEWLEVTVLAHYSWELASFKMDGALWIFRDWEPSAAMLQLIRQRET
ncbi:unnamed protein product [Rhizoctonia solani]|uniref:Uncharacterized protein n=1 Tax=Rhizoctonia solani TaxID=456999 RepID=A0A8H2WCA3_9AGAM|nr:unnamed protein product [Rhizoctonia solani]